MEKNNSKKLFTVSLQKLLFRFKMLRYRYSVLDVMPVTSVVFFILSAYQEVNVE